MSNVRSKKRVKVSDPNSTDKSRSSWLDPEVTGGNFIRILSPRVSTGTRGLGRRCRDLTFGEADPHYFRVLVRRGGETKRSCRTVGIVVPIALFVFYFCKVN